MKAILDKKHNLARGFADVHTPSEVENELLYSWHEKSTDLKNEIKLLKGQIRAETNEGKKNNLISYRKNKEISLAALSTRINKRINFGELVIDRLRQVCTKEAFVRALLLAREDRVRILEKIPITEGQADQVPQFSHIEK